MLDLNLASKSPTPRRAAPQPFTCEPSSNGRSATWIRVCGELDIATGPQFAQTMHEALSGSLLIIVDMRQLAFVDSTGLHLIEEADARAQRSSRRLVFVRGAAQVDRMFELVGLSARLEIIDVKMHSAPAPVDHP